MSGDPWLSVIVPTFNGARYISQALQSVILQADDLTEIVVSDDGSTDDSARIAADYATRYGVAIIRGPCRGNWVANSNHAVERARGRFLAFLHQDDLWLPGRLETVRKIVAAEPDRSLWVGPSWFINSEGRRVGTWNVPFGPTTSGIDAHVFLEHLLVQNFIAMPAPVFPREAFERAGGMDESLWFTADWDLWLRLGAQDGVGLYPMATTAFRLHRQSQTMTGAAEQDSIRRQIETVRARHIGHLKDPRIRNVVERAGRLSSEANATAAALVSRQHVPWQRLLAAVGGAGIGGLRRFLADARFVERSFARLRAVIG